MAVKVKICGITRLEDALLALELGADFLGLNFWEKSPRYISPEQAEKIAREVKGKIELVGVFVNPVLEEVEKLRKELGLDWVQLHGEESPEFCQRLGGRIIKALRLGSEEDLKIIERYSDLLWLVDSKTRAYGGSGISPDWSLARKAQEKLGRIILAGGLKPENVKIVIQQVAPWAVDVASGVESAPGIKDPEKLKKFIEAVKNAT